MKGIPNIFETLVNISKRDKAKLSIVKTSAWVLSNLIRGKPSVEIEEAACAVRICSVFMQVSDKDITSDCLWTLSYLSDGPDENIQLIMEQILD
jgi:hypothetical protein